MNLAASDPLVLFDSGEFDGEGNLYSTPLSNAWIGATKAHGSIHLYFDLELQNNRLEALTFESMNEDAKFQQYEVPQFGNPLNPWHLLPLSEKQKIRAFEYTHRLGEDPQDRCIADLRIGFQTYHQKNEKYMTNNQWTKVFTDAVNPGSLIFPTLIGRELCSFSVSLSLSDPSVLFLPYEWIQLAYLRPSSDAHSWLGAVAMYGPLWAHHDDLLQEVVHAMQVDEQTAEGAAKVAPSVMNSTPPTAQYNQTHPPPEDDDAASAATAQAGDDSRQQQKLSSMDRIFQRRCDLRLFLPVSTKADDLLMATTAKYFDKLKSIDETFEIYPWHTVSTLAKI